MTTTELIDVLSASPDFEGRVAAFEHNLMTLDAAFAHRAAERLAALSLSGPLKALRDDLVTEIRARGQAALYDPQVAWKGDSDLESLIASAPPAVARRLREGADCGAGTRDAAIQALVDLADDTAEDEAALAEVLIPMRDVAFSPRRMSGRQLVYEVVAGEDIRSVAYHLYGDAERWRDVVTAYSLQPPYVSEVPRAGCLSPGTRLVSGTSRLPDAEVGHLGETIQLTAIPVGQRQEWDIAPQAGGGIATVSGPSCLATDCALRLATPLGDLPEHPTYGMPEIIGRERGTARMAQYMMAAETLKEDARVGSVHSSHRAQGVKLLANVTVVPATSESVTYGF